MNYGRTLKEGPVIVAVAIIALALGACLVLAAKLAG